MPPLTPLIPPPPFARGYTVIYSAQKGANEPQRVPIVQFQKKSIPTPWKIIGNS